MDGIALAYDRELFWEGLVSDADAGDNAEADTDTTNQKCFLRRVVGGDHQDPGLTVFVRDYVRLCCLVPSDRGVSLWYNPCVCPQCLRDVSVCCIMYVRFRHPMQSRKHNQEIMRKDVIRQVRFITYHIRFSP